MYRLFGVAPEPGVCGWEFTGAHACVAPITWLCVVQPRCCDEKSRTTTGRCHLLAGWLSARTSVSLYKICTLHLQHRAYSRRVKSLILQVSGLFRNPIVGLKIRRPQGRGGSSPPPGTKQNQSYTSKRPLSSRAAFLCW